MRILQYFTLTLATVNAVNALAVSHDVQDISRRDAEPCGSLLECYAPSLHNALEKRRGGGGRSGGSSSSSSSSSGGRSSSSSSGSTPSNARGSSNAGGRTSSGSGVTPRFGGGRFYGGGAAVPYTAGRRSPRGIVPFFLPLALLAFFPGLWLFGAYAYPWTQPYTFVNETLANDTFPNGVNQTRPVLCLCERYQVCGCDEVDDRDAYMRDIIGNGSYAALNDSLVTVADVNGTVTIAINGTLPNGTTASGGDDDAATSLVASLSGYWVVAGIAVYAVWFL
ncbi:hypothetical protein BDY21DRAFT_292931 [Lineolata rhizophorae]|uniref:DUF7732 domain-containing protein n=1 Tax=Lineolata rhizophorae TaxID=578093 RepID=A0A6A6NP33_9PEZI|nr:hypothetical protein BDY21DRAFT_292931 [Lineolata rhizophorae]